MFLIFSAVAIRVVVTIAALLADTRPLPVSLPRFNIPKVGGIRLARQLLWDGSPDSISKQLHSYYILVLETNFLRTGRKQPEGGACSVPFPHPP